MNVFVNCRNENRFHKAEGCRACWNYGELLLLGWYQRVCFGSGFYPSCDVEAYVKKNLGDVIRPCTKLHVNLYLEVPKAEYEKEGGFPPDIGWPLDSYLKKVASVHEYILAAPFYKYLKALQDGSLSSLYPKILSFYLHEPMYHPSLSSLLATSSPNPQASPSSSPSTKPTTRTARWCRSSFWSSAKPSGPLSALLPSPSRATSPTTSTEWSRRSRRWGSSPSVFGVLGGGWIVAFNEENVAGNRAEKAAALLSSFRFYLDYHVKSSKTFLHGRMRNRAEQWKNCRLWEQCGL